MTIAYITTELQYILSTLLYGLCEATVEVVQQYTFCRPRVYT